MKNVLYNNAKLLGFLGLAIPERFRSHLYRIADNNSGYVLNQEQTEANTTKLL